MVLFADEVGCHREGQADENPAERGPLSAGLGRRRVGTRGRMRAYRDLPAWAKQVGQFMTALALRTLTVRQARSLQVNLVD